MKILLDTHIALWAMTNTAKLSDETKQMIESGRNEVYYSIASVWEIAIKHKIKPEQMPISEKEFAELCEKTGFTQLLIEQEHIFLLKTLRKHNDPFDRILIAQAKSEGMKFLTHDALLPYYNESFIISV